jgi:integrase
VGDQGNEQASSGRRVAPGSVAEIARIGAEVIAAAVNREHLEAWLLLAVEDVLLVGAMDDVLSPTAAYEVAISYLAHLVETGDYVDATLEKAAGLIARFIKYSELRFGITDVRALCQEHVLAFIDAPVLGDELRSAGGRTKDNRRWAIELWFRTLRGLDLYVGDPFLDVERSRRPASASRPLLDVEVERARKHAPSYWGDTLGPVRFALAEAMATTSEIPSIVLADYDRSARRLWLPGTARQLGGRWVPLLTAQIDAIERRIEHLDARDALTPLARKGAQSASGEAISIALRKILVRAGLTRRSDPSVTPSSIRAWGGRRLYDETRDLEDVARCLGLRNLDSARRVIGLAQPEPETPPRHRSAS